MSAPIPDSPSSDTLVNAVVNADTRLVPPRPGRGVVPRTALLDRLTQNRRRRCFVVQGPAGYGKTTMLVAWMRALGAFGYDVAWLSLSEDDNDIAKWIEDLAGSFARVDPAISREAGLLSQVGSGSDAVERTIIALVRGIARHGRELVFVLDDVHLLTDPRVHAALQWLVDYAPANLHLVLASRSAIPASLDRLRAENELLELDAGDLQFSADESEQFLKSQLGELDHTSAQRLHGLTDGWAAGLQLFTLAWKKQRRGTPKPEAALAFFQKQLRTARAFSLYFEREVLDRLAPPELDLLVRVSPCSRFCASLCARLLDDGTTQAEAAARLARLESDNLFISRVGTEQQDPWYRLHPLLNEAMAERFAGLDATARRALQQSAWHWFRDRGLPEEAVQHALDAGEPQAAAEMVEACAEDLFLRGERVRLMTLVRLLPKAQVQRSLALQLWMARVQLYRRELDDCAASLDAVDEAMPRDDEANRFMLIALRGALAVLRDDTDSAQSVLPRLEVPPAAATAVTLGGSRHILCWLYMRQGRFEQARSLLSDPPAAQGLLPAGSVTGTLYGQCLAGLSYLIEGRMTEAERICRPVLRDAEAGGMASADTANLAIALLGEILYEQGEDQRVRDLLEARVDVLEYISLPDAVLRLMTVLSGTRWTAGHRLEAFSYLERLEDFAIRLGLDRLLAHCLALQAWRRTATGEVAAAQECLERLATIDARYAHHAQSPFSEIHHVAQVAALRWRLETGDIEQARRDIGNLLDDCARHGRQRETAALFMQRAVVETRSGRPAAAQADVTAALELGHKLGLMRTLVDSHADAPALIAQVAADPALDPVLGFYAERVLRRNEALAAAQAGKSNRNAPATAPKLSQREADVVWLLGQALTAKKIARALGLSPETVKWHLTNIYGKLGVSGRDEAIERIRDLQVPRGQGTPHSQGN